MCLLLKDEKWNYRTILTEAHCKRNEDGASMRTGHESEIHEATAIACKRYNKLDMQPLFLISIIRVSSKYVFNNT